MYTERNLVRIAKRENNQKRKYLVMNRLQGKHIPVKPHEALAMFQALANQLREQYNEERLLVIGFAETATAIGVAVAAALDADYIQTTREIVPNVEYLYFSEEHSHATEQKLVKNDIDCAVKTINRILFVEDEVTTGKTIRNIIDVLKKQYPQKIQFSVASILNGMNQEALDIYNKYGIDLFWLVKTNHFAYTEIAEHFKGDGIYINCKDDNSKENPEAKSTILEQTKWKDSVSNRNLIEHQIDDKNQPAEQIYWDKMPKITYLKVTKHMDTRRVVSSTEYCEFCESLYQEVFSQINLRDNNNILVLGTEEYMYPALYTANKLEAQGKEVRFHATTRSPIAVSTEENYPLQVRYELASLYDSKRTTYVYNLRKYDIVVIMTDASDGMTAGVGSLVSALKLCGNAHIIFVW